MVPSHPTYDQVHAACASLADRLKDVQFDCVVGLARGGLLPAVILSHLLKVPMISAHYSSKKGEGDNRDHANDLPLIKGKKILLVDDICDSGNTLEEVVVFYNVLECDVTSAVLYCKEENHHIPTIYHWEIPTNFGWIYFPWETE